MFEKELAKVPGLTGSQATCKSRTHRQERRDALAARRNVEGSRSREVKLNDVQQERPVTTTSFSGAPPAWTPAQFRQYYREGNLMRFLIWTLFLAAGLSAQAVNAPSDPVSTLISRLELERYKAHIKGLSQFGDRMQGTKRNRDAIDWLEKQLRSFGYSNVERHRFMADAGPLENIYATKVGTGVAEEMYIVSAHMDGRGGGEAADDDASGCAVVLELARVLAMPEVRTNRSVRFIFWNNEEFGMDGSGTYALERSPLQGTASEPKWLGVIQHDMMMFDHGMPPGPKQSPNADINIDYQENSLMGDASAKLAAVLKSANLSQSLDYPATIGTNMAGTDSIRFQDLVASVSVRENERVTGIVMGSNPNHHKPTDKYANYGEQDFRFGFDSARTTLGGLGQLAGITLVQRR
ncbi:MAG: M20/M25/M40 family metallo-hydrolase [Acidobacteriota bacterium]